MDKKNVFVFIFIFSFASLNIFGQKKELPDIAPYYNPSKEWLRPQYKIYHINQEKSTIYFRNYLPELNFIRSTDNKLEAKIKIKCIFYKSLESKEIIDSVSKIVIFKETDIKKSIISYFDMKIPAENCKLVVITKDLYNGQKGLNIIDINKKPSSFQNFLLFEAQTFKPIFTNYMVCNKAYKLKYNKNVDSFLVTKYLSDTVLAKSPFSNSKVNYTPKQDSFFYVKNLEEFTISEPGTYSFTDEKNDISYYISCFDDNFPTITTVDDMIPPLQYICSTKEYKDINNKINKKIAVDDFWLSTSKSAYDAKLLIKVYYNRILYANTKFTTTRQGWKTDRGMIYVILGPPTTLFIGDNFEEWIYSNNFWGAGVTLRFNYEQNPFSENKYTLKQEPTLKDYWRKAVERWKTGQVFIF